MKPTSLSAERAKTVYPSAEVAAAPAGIYCLTINDWDFPWWTDRQHLMSRLARQGWPVCYATRQLNLWDRGKGAWRRAGLATSVEQTPSGVRVIRPGRSIARTNRVQAWDDWTLSRYARQISGNLDSLAGSRPRIAIVAHPSQLDAARALRPDRMVLYMYDAWPLSAGWNAGLARQLETIVDKADLIVAIAESMARHLPGDGFSRAHILPHGVDAQQIRKTAAGEVPRELAAIPHPRLAYFGRVSKKCDLALLRRTAEQRPDWQLVVVGQADTADQKEWRALTDRPNVHVLGSRPQPEIGAYMAHCDVNLLPYKRDDTGYWSGVFPLKTYEYLAAGPPVVATAIESLADFGHLIGLAQSQAQWTAAIEAALDGRSPSTADSRLEVALANTWDSRTSKLEAWLRALV